MAANRILNLKKCGEILIDINSKNKKHKIYIFHCTLCNIECDQLKKFSIHIGKEHLGNFGDILSDSGHLKLDNESNEIRIQTCESIEEPDIKVLENSVDDQLNASPDPLDTVCTVNTTILNESLNCNVKHKLFENSIGKCTFNDKAAVVSSNYLSDTDYEANLKIDTPKVKADKFFAISSNSDEARSDIEQMPFKKRKLAITKKVRKTKQKATAVNNESDESKCGDSNVEKESNASKKHKRCKKRWKNIDDSKLPILIEMYKKYEVLWQVNDIAFGILPKRNETFGTMIEELNSNYKFNKNLDELQDHIDYINYIFCKDKEHELQCELNQTEFKPSSKYYKELSFLSDSQGPFKCLNCNEIITKYDRFRIHVAQHNGSIPFQCRLCEMGFQKFDNYLRHVTRHLGINSYHCNVCGKGYPFKSELDWHLTSHTGVKPYLCPICGAGFRARHGYDNHIRRHEKRFRYECHICKHGFNHLCKLNTHIKSHLNIRDVICNVCGKGFTAAKYLQRHKLIHEEEKRYKCNVCGKAFAQDSGLRTHRKQHQPYALIAENKKSLKKCV